MECGLYAVMDGLLVCGNLNMDRILTVDYLPESGQSTPVRKQRLEFGGCGGNISVSAAKLGTDVYLSSVVGRDLDPGYRKRLEHLGIDLSNLVVDPDLPSPFCIVLSAPNGEQAYAFMMGAMEKQSELNAEFRLGGSVRFCHIATSDPGFANRTAGMMKEKGISTAFDPGQEIYFRWKGGEVAEMLKRCDRFFGNLGEWQYLLDILDIQWEERGGGGVVYPWSDSIFDLIGEAVVTLGDRGSMLLRKDRMVIVPAVDVDVVDATGAGDAFRGGFYSALLRGYPIEEALLFGNGMGALSITGSGPQGYEASWEKLEEILKNEWKKKWARI